MRPSSGGEDHSAGSNCFTSYMKYRASVRFAPLSIVANTPGWPSVGTIVALWKPASRARFAMYCAPSFMLRFSAAMEGSAIQSCSRLMARVATGFCRLANRRITVGGARCARRTEQHRAGACESRGSQEFAAIKRVRSAIVPPSLLVFRRWDGNVARFCEPCSGMNRERRAARRDAPCERISRHVLRLTTECLRGDKSLDTPDSG
jgi:hypothetical protein